MARSWERASIYHGNRRLPIWTDPARRGRRNGIAESIALPLTDPFVISEDEELALDDCSSAGRAKLVAYERRLISGIKVIGGVEICVSNELVRTTMDLVRAGFGDGIDDPAGGEAVHP